MFNPLPFKILCYRNWNSYSESQVQLYSLITVPLSQTINHEQWEKKIRAKSWQRGSGIRRINIIWRVSTTEHFINHIGIKSEHIKGIQSWKKIDERKEVGKREPWIRQRKCVVAETLKRNKLIQWRPWTITHPLSRLGWVDAFHVGRFNKKILRETTPPVWYFVISPIAAMFYDEVRNCSEQRVFGSREIMEVSDPSRSPFQGAGCTFLFKSILLWFLPRCMLDHDIVVHVMMSL